MKNLRRGRGGQYSTELAASFMFIIPVIVVAIYVCLQCVQAYMIYCTLKQASAQAARKFAVTYTHNPNALANNWADVVLSIEYPGVVNSYKQFELVEFSPEKIPPTVTMKVNYAPDAYGCRHFPEPDILGLGRYFLISAQSTEKLD
ncbi:MAG: hypothetical protein SFV17_11905 [Candidatus Obscuribacter sp.]|nr:hypothetical protein [Candidatus Obscuribacter sp.]